MVKIYLFVALSFWLVATQNLDQKLCEPFAPRLSLGYYYATGGDDYIELAFNTNFTCPDAFINIWTGTDAKQKVIVDSTQLLNMSAIYENFTTQLNFTYFTYVQTVILLNLTEGQTYSYELVGNSTNGAVGPFQFTVPYRDTPTAQRIVVMGDMDSVWFPPNMSGPTFNWFQNQLATNQSAYDMLVFLGDMAYNLEAQDCYRGDFWLRNLSTFAAYWPLQISVGNHDAGNNSQFPMVRSFFRSPQQVTLNTPELFYNIYSWDLGLAHFVNFQPYWIVYNWSTPDQNQTIYNAMRQDLIKANASREERPWLIVISHYPMYCSDPTNPMCPSNWYVLQAFTQLFQEFKVDLYLGAHQHDYERDKPTFNNITANYTSADSGHVVIDADAPLYLLEGAAGNNYFMPNSTYQIQPFTQAQSINVGVGLLTILNRTHLYFEQVDSATNEVLDYVYLQKPDPYADDSRSAWKYWWVWTLVIVLVLAIVVAGVVWFKKRKASKGSPRSYSMQGDALNEI